MDDGGGVSTLELHIFSCDNGHTQPVQKEGTSRSDVEQAHTEDNSQDDGLDVAHTQL